MYFARMHITRARCKLTTSVCTNEPTNFEVIECRKCQESETNAIDNDGDTQKQGSRATSHTQFEFRVSNKAIVMPLHVLCLFVYKVCRQVRCGNIVIIIIIISRSLSLTLYIYIHGCINRQQQIIVYNLQIALVRRHIHKAIAGEQVYRQDKMIESG